MSPAPCRYSRYILYSDLSQLPRLRSSHRCSDPGSSPDLRTLNISLLSSHPATPLLATATALLRAFRPCPSTCPRITKDEGAPGPACAIKPCRSPIKGYLKGKQGFHVFSRSDKAELSDQALDEHKLIMPHVKSDDLLHCCVPRLPLAPHLAQRLDFDSAVTIKHSRPYILLLLFNSERVNDPSN